ncbi:prepilin-type N-terminal cleavage/methylation domain-containing protein [Flavobacteriaceae bacterium M23B6Z8]
MNKSSSHKVRAFTLSELVVVLLLTTIVIGLAFSVLGLVQQHMEAIRTNFNRNEELQKLEQLLWLDMNRYPKVFYKQIDDELLFYSPLDTISYVFEPEKIIRQTDTLFIGIAEKKFYLDGTEKFNGSIDAVELKTDKNTLEQSLFIFRRNDATLYMNGL